MLRPGDHIWAGVGQSPLLVAHEREDLPSRALRPLRLPNQDFVLHYQGKYYTTAVKTLDIANAVSTCKRGFEVGLVGEIEDSGGEDGP